MSFSLFLSLYSSLSLSLSLSLSVSLKLLSRCLSRYPSIYLCLCSSLSLSLSLCVSITIHIAHKLCISVPLSLSLSFSQLISVIKLYCHLEWLKYYHQWSLSSLNTIPLIQHPINSSLILFTNLWISDEGWCSAAVPFCDMSWERNGLFVSHSRFGGSVFRTVRHWDVSPPPADLHNASRKDCRLLITRRNCGPNRRTTAITRDGTVIG